MIVLLWLAFGVASALLAQRKGRSTGLWLLYGIALGPIAVLHVLITHTDASRAEAMAVRDRGMRKCPACAELVKAEAVICRFCHSPLPPLPAAAAAPPARSESAERDRRTGTMALVALASVIGLLLMFGSRGGTGYSAEQLRIDECAARGVAYFKEIGSFPTLSNGRDARSEATERCRRTTSAF